MKWQTIHDMFKLIFVKYKKQNVVCAHEFSWFAKKVICTIYNILGISALISGAIFDENFLKQI